MSLKSETKRILKQLLGCAIIAGALFLFFWWRYGDIATSFTDGD